MNATLPGVDVGTSALKVTAISKEGRLLAELPTAGPGLVLGKQVGL